MVDIYFKHPFTTTKEFLTKQIFSSEILISFSDREFRDFSNGPAALLEHLQEGPLAPEDASVDKEAGELSPDIGAALPAVIQSSLLNLSANNYKNLSPPPFFLPPSASRSLAPRCSRPGAGSGCSAPKSPSDPREHRSERRFSCRWKLEVQLQ